MPYTRATARRNAYGHLRRRARRRLHSFRLSMPMNNARIGYFSSKRRLQRAAKRRRFAPSNLGHPAGADTAKRHQASNLDSSPRSDRTIYDFNVTLVPKTTTNVIDQRQRDLINMRGVKICMEVTNNTADPLYFNLAVISPRNKAAVVVSNTNFFRANVASRAVNFDSTSLNGLDYACRPINTDEFIVLRHWRYTLIGTDNTSGTVAMSGKNTRVIMKYVPIKRQIRYDSSSNPINGNVFVVYWAAKYASPSGVSPVANQYNTTQELITYFREPCC